MKERLKKINIIKKIAIVAGIILGVIALDMYLKPVEELEEYDEEDVEE